jgi:4-amino-4-deoxy-L-arabinose transferase-like glycosyltransferase
MTKQTKKILPSFAQFGDNRIHFMPKRISNISMVTYFMALMACTLLYSSHILDWKWWIFGIISVVGFFHFANQQTKLWLNIRPTTFSKRLFWGAFVLRVLWVLISYYLYFQWTGTAFSIDAADELFYDDMGHYGASLMREGNFAIYSPMVKYAGKVTFSDMGYPIYLSILYYIFFDSILMARIIKAILSAWTAVLVYKVAARNFGESTGRMAGIFCMLMPNLIYYCSFQLKEVEMVFLAMLFVERADWLLRQPKLKVMQTVAVMLIPLALFMIRTALAATLVAAFFCALLLTTGRVSGVGKRAVLIVVAGIFAATMFVTSTSIGQDVKQMWETRDSGQQSNMEWRSTRDNGNVFAKHAGAAVFAPMIFTIPFPTMAEVPNQENQKMIHGGNFVKNIVSYFTIMALLILLVTGNWRKHVLPLAILCGYLVVLVFSSFAQSERFHQPILPLTLMFAALGISLIKENPWMKRYFNYWCVLMFIAAIAWNWFKLAGRGMF